MDENSTEVARRQAPRQPHQLDVALRFPLKAATRLKPVEVAVKVDLQHCRGVVGRATRGGGLDTLKPQRPKIKLVNKGFDDTTPAGPRPDAARVGPAHPVRCYDFF